MLKFLFRLTLLYVGLMIIFVAALFNANCISYSSVRENIVESYLILSSEGYSKEIVSGVFITRLDNFTDAWMINLCHPDSTVSKVENTFRDTYYNGPLTNPMGVYPIPSLLIGTDASPSPVTILQYPRYWHGYLSTLKPILTILNYSQIRILNFVLLFALALFALIITYMRRGALCLWALLVALCISLFPMVPLSLQFSTCFYIALISLVLLLSFPSLVRSTSAGFLSFFIIGAVTVYFDFLTTPLLTLGIPAAIVLFKHPQSMKRSILWSIAWFAGYAILWSSKWILASLVLGPDVWQDVFDNVKKRSIGHVDVNTLSDYIYNSYTLAIVITLGVAIILIAAYIFCHRRLKMPLFRSMSYLAVLCMPVILWCLVLHNHVSVHISFTWRIVSIPFICGIMYVWTIFFSSNESRSLNTLL